MSTSELQLDFIVPNEHASYADHFPDEPIVPGALLVQWVLRELKDAEVIMGVDTNGLKTNFKERVESFKFLRKVKPGDRGKLNVKCKDSGRIDVICTMAETAVFKGVFNSLTDQASE